ncbi:unnamed protein product [Lampetra fluviatilis]
MWNTRSYNAECARRVQREPSSGTRTPESRELHQAASEREAAWSVRGSITGSSVGALRNLATANLASNHRCKNAECEARGKEASRLAGSRGRRARLETERRSGQGTRHDRHGDGA